MLSTLPRPRLAHKILRDQEVILAKLAQVLTNRESLQGMPEMVGTSAKFGAALKEAQSVAGTDTADLLRGETGTGKELLAHHIHARSQRRRLPLMTINCAALLPRRKLIGAAAEYVGSVYDQGGYASGPSHRGLKSAQVRCMRRLRAAPTAACFLGLRGVCLSVMIFMRPMLVNP